ncbi:MAG: dephospho-CoA kinase [Parasporobacterium sp.]|nr:dephospho-CoA kinase [Parasporobacterium sp.]
MIIGVTGGVGTGKSSILQILNKEFDAVVIMADEVSRDLMMPGEESYLEVVRYFGDGILTGGPQSPIDRAELARIVFQDPEKLNALNNINHPLVRKRIEALLKQYQKEAVRLIVIETAILIQVGYQDLVDELWVVHTDPEIRVQRLIDSRGYTREKIADIMKNQLPDHVMEQAADFVIDNSADLDSARRQIEEHLNRFGIGPSDRKAAP